MSIKWKIEAQLHSMKGPPLGIGLGLEDPLLNGMGCASLTQEFADNFMKKHNIRDVTPARTEDTISGDSTGPYQLIIDHTE